MKSISLKLIFVLITLFVWRGFENKLEAQNLVKNPSFENYIQCPICFNYFNGYIQDWYAFQGGNNGSSFSSYFNSCSPLPFSVPQNTAGWQMAKTGEGYACIQVYSFSYSPNRRAYIEGCFLTPLKADSIYCIEFWASFTGIGLFNRPIKNVDAHFSDTLLDWNNGLGNNLIGITPQIRSQQILSDSAGWTKVSGLYIAHGGEKYITIGNFNDNAHTTTSPPDDGTTENAFASGYYIDDVSVTPIGATVPFLGSDTMICKSQMPLMLNAPYGYDSYLWSNGNTNSTISVSDSGFYWVRCIMNGCGELNDSIHIGFINTPTLSLGSDTVICKGNSVTLAGQTGFLSYLWSTSDPNQSIVVSNSGLYTLWATDVCGLQKDSIQVTVDSLPNITIDLGVDTTVCPDGIYTPYILSVSVILPDYQWNTGETTPQITIYRKGVYYMKSHYYCGTLYSDTIFVEECPIDTNFTFYIPNSFSPNDDGINDSFQPVFYNITITNAEIYNRWGNLVYENNKQFLWDGRYRGIECPEGVYFYKLTYKDVLNNFYKKSGTVSLVR